MSRIAASACVIVLSASLAACGRSGFDARSDTSFARDCARNASGIAPRLRVDPALVAGVFGYFANQPLPVMPGRRFEASRPPRVVGSEVLVSHDLEASCQALFVYRDALASVDADIAVNGGLSHWFAALNEQFVAVKSMKRVIEQAVRGQRAASGRTAELIGRFAPKGKVFHVMRSGTRMVPAIDVEAVNPLDLPIEAFYFAVDLKRPNGSILAKGRFTFKPPSALGPGVEAAYTIQLDTVAGFGDPQLLDVRDNLTVDVRTEDVASGGVRLLAETIADPEDGRRIDALGVLIGRIEEFKDRIRRFRERLS